MEITTLIAIIGLGITVVANIIAIVVFLTRQSDNIKFLQETFSESKKNVMESVNEYKISISEKFDEFKLDIKEKIEHNQSHTEEHIKRLEVKQDKHNNLIERMAIVEQSTKSAHHRLDMLEKE